MNKRIHYKISHKYKREPRCEKTKGRFLPQDIDVQAPCSPIIIREILSKSSLSNQSFSKNPLPWSSNICPQPSKPPIILDMIH